MDIRLEPARMEELEPIWSLVGRAVVHMNALGNPQWGEDYPTADFYREDIRRGELYAAYAGGTLAGVACINTSEAPEYAAMPWTTTPPDGHRPGLPAPGCGAGLVQVCRRLGPPAGTYRPAH